MSGANAGPGSPFRALAARSCRSSMARTTVTATSRAIHHPLEIAADTFPIGGMLMKFLPFMLATILTVTGIIMALALSGCTFMQKAVVGGAVGGVAGFALAGPIGAGVGAAGGAIATPMVGR
jgi:hypothetical protein